jgi:hypothetical protein
VNVLQITVAARGTPDGDSHIELIEKPFDYADLEATLRNLGVHFSAA